MKMIENKDFLKYSANKYGQQPRKIAINEISNAIKKISSKKMKDIIVVEFGFNHGNDSRYIIDTLVSNVGFTGWQYWGYDHEDYFMPENIFDYCSLRGINESQIHLVPCTFENVAQDRVFLPRDIDLVYSSKSLSMCDSDCFPKLIQKICGQIDCCGILICSLHLRNESTPWFLTKEDYINMISNVESKDIYNAVFKKFFSRYCYEMETQTFALVSEKTLNHSIIYDENILK